MDRFDDNFQPSRRPLIVRIIGIILIIAGISSMFSALFGNSLNADGSMFTIAERFKSFFWSFLILVIPGILMFFSITNLLRLISNLCDLITDIAKLHIIFKQSKLKKKAQKYINLINIEGIRELNEISKRLNIPINTVKNDIEELIAEGILDYQVESKKMIHKVIKCKNCAADNLITVGVPAECEYCRSPLNVE